MIRPHASHRSPQFTFDILRRVKLEHGDRVQVRIFGVRAEDAFWEHQRADFDYQVLGILTREQVAELLREAYLFIDASSYQAFGRTGLEAMACGCATILPGGSGTSEYAVNKVNTLLANPLDEDNILAKVREYLGSAELTNRIIEAGLATAKRYTVECSSRSELEWFDSLRRQAAAPDKRRRNGVKSLSFLDEARARQAAALQEDIFKDPISHCPYKFRITVLSSTTNIHGGTRRLLNLAQHLHLRKHHVTFVTHHHGRELDWFHLDAPLREIRFDANTPPDILEKTLPDADILLTYGNNRAAELLGRLSRRKGIKYLLFMHMGVHDSVLDNKNALLPRLHKLCTSSWIAEELDKLGVNATPISFGVDQEQFYPVELDRALRVGMLLHKDEWKRSQDAIDAFKLVRR